MAVFTEQVPGFAIKFVVVVAGVASGTRSAVGVEPEIHFRRGSEDFHGRDEIPGLRLYDVKGKQVKFGGVVATFAGAAVAETAEVSAALASAG